MKTLEYMGERVDQARETIKKQEKLEGQLKHLQKEGVRVDGLSVTISTSRNPVYISGSVCADVHEALIQILKNEITYLDEQLIKL